MTGRHRVLPIPFCAVGHRDPDPLATPIDSAECPLVSCRTGWVACPERQKQMEA